MLSQGPLQKQGLPHCWNADSVPKSRNRSHMEASWPLLVQPKKMNVNHPSSLRQQDASIRAPFPLPQQPSHEAVR